MIVRRIARWTLTAVLLTAMSVAFSGCGKKGGLTAPKDEKEKYTYPRQYPR